MLGRIRSTRKPDATPEEQREIDRFTKSWQAGRNRKPNILEDRPGATAPPIPEDLAREIQEMLDNRRDVEQVSPAEDCLGQLGHQGKP